MKGQATNPHSMVLVVSRLAIQHTHAAQEVHTVPVAAKSCQGGGQGLHLRSLVLLFLPDPGINSLLTSQRQTRTAGTNCFGGSGAQKPLGMQVAPSRDLQGAWPLGQGTENKREHMETEGWKEK